MQLLAEQGLELSLDGFAELLARCDPLRSPAISRDPLRSPAISLPTLTLILDPNP